MLIGSGEDHPGIKGRLVCTVFALPEYCTNRESPGRFGRGSARGPNGGRILQGEKHPNQIYAYVLLHVEPSQLVVHPSFRIVAHAIIGHRPRQDDIKALLCFLHRKFEDCERDKIIGSPQVPRLLSSRRLVERILISAFLPSEA